MNKNTKMIGKSSVCLGEEVYILSAASVVGKKEGEGPLGRYFDQVIEDPMCGKESWEEAESYLQQAAAECALQKGHFSPKDIRYLLSGDLLGQLIATSFGVEGLGIPVFGLYGACSTMGEAVSLGSILIDGGYADKVLAMTSSHFCGAEKQFRFPLGYGNQRPLAATWTVTGSGAVILGNSYKEENKPLARVSAVTTGKIVDYGVKDSMNMGACMAPAAADVICRNFEDFCIKPEEYDRIITGDLGMVGKDIIIDLVKGKGYDIKDNYMDCGIEIYDPETQDTHSGGSGCGCSAVTLCAYILEQIKTGYWKKVLFVPTGALLSPVSFNEGKSVPGIAHAVVLETVV